MTEPRLPLDEDDPVILAGEYALGVLPPDAARALDRRLAIDPLLRAEVARWQTDLATLADAVPAVPPPARSFDRIEARLFPEVRQSIWRRLGIAPALAGALVAALILLLVTNLGLLMTGDPAMPVRIAAADDSLVIAALWDAEAGRLTLTQQAGAAPEGRVLELWLIAAESAPVSLGVLAEANSTVLMPAALASLMPGATLAITDEPPGGAPGGIPTGTVMATGQVDA